MSAGLGHPDPAWDAAVARCQEELRALRRLLRMLEILRTSRKVSPPGGSEAAMIYPSLEA